MQLEKNSFLQTQFWTDVKKSEGWSNIFIDGVYVLTKEIKKNQLLAYIPHGYPSETFSQNELEKISKDIKNSLSKKLFCIRWDLPLYETYTVEEGIDTNFNFKIKSPFIKGFSDVQPPDTVVLDLKKSEDELLSSMHKKTKYNIKLAEKKGVVVKLEDSSNLDAWYSLYQTTATRDKIAIHSKQYYKHVFENASKYEDRFEKPHFRLYSAYHEGQLLAGIIVCFYKDRAVYVYGASSNEKRNLMPAYLLQWTAIVDAKNAGCNFYDMFGIPPTNSKGNSMQGLYRFKTGFGGALIHRTGTYDFPVKKVVYKLFRILEALRFFYYKKLKKR